MQEMNPLEKQLRSWTPRRPSAKIARRLFATTAPAAVFLRRAEVWNWFTPVAACILTLMVAAHTASRHFAAFEHAGRRHFFCHGRVQCRLFQRTTDLCPEQSGREHGMERLAASSGHASRPSRRISFQFECLECDSNQPLKFFQAHLGGDRWRGRFWPGQATTPEAEAVTNMADKDQDHNPSSQCHFLNGSAVTANRKTATA